MTVESKEATEELARQIAKLVEGHTEWEGLLATILVARALVQRVLDQKPPASVARPFRLLQDMLEANITAASMSVSG